MRFILSNNPLQFTLKYGLMNYFMHQKVLKDILVKVNLNLLSEH